MSTDLLSHYHDHCTAFGVKWVSQNLCLFADMICSQVLLILCIDSLGIGHGLCSVGDLSLLLEWSWAGVKGWRQLTEAGAGIGEISLYEFLSGSLSCSTKSGKKVSHYAFYLQPWKCDWFSYHRKPITYVVCLGCKSLVNMYICCFDLVWVPKVNIAEFF